MSSKSRKRKQEKAIPSAPLGKCAPAVNLKDTNDIPTCSHCHAPSASLKKCGRCRTALYCGSACQKAHWKAGHKGVCVVKNVVKASPTLSEWASSGGGALGFQGLGGVPRQGGIFTRKSLSSSYNSYLVAKSLGRSCGDISKAGMPIKMDLVCGDGGLKAGEEFITVGWNRIDILPELYSRGPLQQYAFTGFDVVFRCTCFQTPCRAVNPTEDSVKACIVLLSQDKCVAEYKALIKRIPKPIDGHQHSLMHGISFLQNVLTSAEQSELLDLGFLTWRVA